MLLGRPKAKHGGHWQVIALVQRFSLSGRRIGLEANTSRSPVIHFESWGKTTLGSCNSGFQRLDDQEESN